MFNVILQKGFLRPNVLQMFDNKHIFWNKRVLVRDQNQILVLVQETRNQLRYLSINIEFREDLELSTEIEILNVLQKGFLCPM